MREPSSRPSTKRPANPSSATAAPAARPWRVDLHREVIKVVAIHGVDSNTFRPTLAALIDALESDPKQFPKKRGKLARARAAPLTFAGGISWRAVFRIDERERLVRVIALGPHDAAYADAQKRL